MKIPKKVIVVILVVIGLGGVGTIISKKVNNSATQMDVLNFQDTAKVEKGDLKVELVSSGVVDFEDKEAKNPNNLKVQINVNAEDISKLRKGQVVNIKVDSLLDKEVKGYISKITQTTDEQSKQIKYNVDIAIKKSLHEVGKINSEEVSIKSGKSNEYQSIKTINKDEKVSILEKSNKWYKVMTEDGIIGWTRFSNVDIEGLNVSNLNATIKEESVSVYKGAGTKTGLTTKIVEGDIVTILEKKDDWYKVKLLDNQEGWIRNNQVITEELKAGMKVTTSITTESEKDTMYVPIGCVTKTNEGYKVTLAGSNEEREVKVGINNEDYIEIKEGVSQKDELVVTNGSDKNEPTLNMGGIVIK
ncbi:MAG: SH3 domain-containing protein [Paraclostridium sp.]